MRKKDIKLLTMGVIEEYETNNPFKLTELLNLHVLFHNLPESLDAYRLGDVIILNKKLSYEKQKWVLAHELGHYFMHGSEYTLAKYMENELLIKSKIEKEADIFASELLLCDINKQTIDGFTSKQLSVLFCVPEEYIKYKLAE